MISVNLSLYEKSYIININVKLLKRKGYKLEINNMNNFDTTTLTEKVYRKILFEIIRKEVKSGDKLKETEIAERLNISKAPVREALIHLTKDGFVMNITRKGFFVIELDKKSIEELLEIRIVLELYALEKAINNIDGKDIEFLESLLNKGKKLISIKNLVEYTSIDKEFHLFIISKSNNRKLVSLLKSYIRQNFMLFDALNYEIDIENVLEEHDLLLSAIKDRDKEKAANLLKKHIEMHKNRITSISFDK